MDDIVFRTFILKPLDSFINLLSIDIDFFGLAQLLRDQEVGVTTSLSCGALCLECVLSSIVGVVDHHLPVGIGELLDHRIQFIYFS